MIRTIIIDDEVSAINNLEKLLSGFSEIEIIDRIADPTIALKIIKSLDPDLIFLDIQMPGIDGFELIQELNQNKLTPEIIFVTAHDEYAIKAIRLSAFDYILKPVDKKELENAINRFLESRSQPSSGEKDSKLSQKFETLLSQVSLHQKLKFATGSGFLLIDPKDILYILADWNYSEIHFDDSKHELITQNLGAIEKILAASLFYRISRSIIINIRYLSKVNRKKRTAILVKDGKEYPFKIPLLNIRKLERFLES